MKNDNKKAQNGITLVALVITIIVLLILAGVSIITLTGKNGILIKSKEAGKISELKEIEEMGQMSLVARKIDEKIIGEEATLAGVISDLKSMGYKIEQTVSDSTDVEKIMLSRSEIAMSRNATEMLSYTLVYKNKGAQYFVKVQGNYYEIVLNNGKISVNTEIADFEKIKESSQIRITSSNNNLLKIEEGENGQITLKSENEVGETTIKVREEKSGIEASCVVTVKIPVTALTVNPATTVILLGDTIKLTANPTPTNTTEKITWNTSDASIATVSKDGSVKGEKEGKVTITASCGEKSASCKIIISLPGKAATVTKNMYGKYVTNYDNTNHWQIFFTDLEKIYLIYDDVIADPIYNDNTLKSAVDAGNYVEGTKMLSDKNRFPGYEWNYSTNMKNVGDSYECYQAYLFLMDSGNVWNQQYKTTYMDYAIGGPTPEMIQQARACQSRNQYFLYAPR